MDSFRVSPQNNNKEEELLLQEDYSNLVMKYHLLLEESKLNVDLEEKYEKLKRKHKNLVEKLRERIECPVCLEVPEANPISACPNGHLVCSKCVGNNCPTCRSKMLNGKSLLALTVLENIEHKCHNLGCDKEFPLAELMAHKVIWLLALLLLARRTFLSVAW